MSQPEPERGDSRKPVFGERMRGIYASESNPRRDGIYVQTIHKTGRTNPGKWYQMTDGNGDFWQCRPESTVFLSVAACTWTEDPDWGTWDTACGGCFGIDEGTPEENGMKFCCYCGKPLVAELVKELYDPDDDEVVGDEL